jgi:hypothetical protein
MMPNSDSFERWVMYVLAHAVGEIFLLRVAAHVVEREDGDGTVDWRRWLLG